jgi:hypothetical protein
MPLAVWVLLADVHIISEEKIKTIVLLITTKWKMLPINHHNITL